MIKLKPKVESQNDDKSTQVEELTIEKRFTKKELREHALELPDTYIGSVEVHEENMWIVNPEYDPGQLIADDISETASSTANSSNTSLINTEIKMARVQYVPGLYKIYDEVLVNAMDHWTRMEELIRKQNLIKAGKMEETPEVTLRMKLRPVRNIMVEIDQEANRISVKNDGDGIPVAIHEEFKVYVPELLFSQFLASGNFKGDDINQIKIIGGKNGFGAKLTALFSKRFTIETVDHNRKKKYTQTYLNNLNTIEPPTIEDNYRGLPYTKITFEPDLERFGLSQLTDDMVGIFHKRVYDASAWCQGVDVFYNQNKLTVKDFNTYTNLFLGKLRTGNQGRKRHYVQVNDRWEICVTYSNDHEFQQTSIVNGIMTIKGGRHVNYVADQISKAIAEQISTAKLKVDPKTVKSNMWVFVRCVIENPSFDSQTKETLTSQIRQFGSKCEISAEDIKKIGSVGIAKRSKAFSEFKDIQTSKQSDGKKSKRVDDVDKLSDARNAGGRLSARCSLILTEGDSAKEFANNGLLALTASQREFYGVFPLRGKLKNVRDATQKQIDGNEEITALKKIIGLVGGVDYSKPENFKKLRYGKVLILTDQDADGEHIKGLVMNFFHKFWPGLLETNKFIHVMITPILMVWKERKAGRRKVEKYSQKRFYSQNQYLEWRESQSSMSGWHTRYYKGLGTSTNVQAKESFADPKIIRYLMDQPREEQDSHLVMRMIRPTDKAMELAFTKKNADLRKKWLNQADLTAVNEYDIESETYQDFVDKRLVQFSWNDVCRSVPNICDGLKPVQRKVLFYCLKNNVKNSIKVAQLGGKIAEATCYHHGDTSMYGTIVGMAQNYVGSNNINLLFPDGQFGSKVSKGKNSASPRYIFSRLENLTPFIYKTEDMSLYRYCDDDGVPVEPEWFLPIIPMALVNGVTCGIGTGWSTYIPRYNPLDIIRRLKKMLRGEIHDQIKDQLHPWYRGYTGKIEANDVRNYTVTGNYEMGSNVIKVKELPIGNQAISFTDYKYFLDDIIKFQDWPPEKKPTKKHDGHKNPPVRHPYLEKIVREVKIDEALCQAEIYFKPNGLAKLLSEKGVIGMEKMLRLRTNLALTNIHLFNSEMKIKKYTGPDQIIEEFYGTRLKYYDLRKKVIVAEGEFNLLKMSSKYRFVTEIMEEKIVIYRKTKVQIIQILEENNYPKYQGKFDPCKIINLNTQPQITTTDAEPIEEQTEEVSSASYNYLLSMRIDSFSDEILQKLKEERDILDDKLTKLKAKTIEELWLDDLTELEDEYLEWITEWYEENEIPVPFEVKNYKNPLTKIKLNMNK